MILYKRDPGGSASSCVIEKLPLSPGGLRVPEDLDVADTIDPTILCVNVAGTVNG